MIEISYWKKRRPAFNYPHMRRPQKVFSTPNVGLCIQGKKRIAYRVYVLSPLLPLDRQSGTTRDWDA